ncbi:MAG: sporulation membrane protein YtaF [Paenibacillaceae bacterium]|nr:sporulation membrane protein YtaF [Paenibacillaceae bacterium]
MLAFLSLSVLAFALSLDSFGVGVTYGLRRIKIPMLSLAIIAALSGAVIFASMQIGVWLADYVSESLAKAAGAVILVGIGIWAVVQVILRKSGDAPSQDISPEQAEAEPQDMEPDEKRPIVHIEIKMLGLVIQILRTPHVADVDRSGAISSSEALLLGLALSLDAFGAGIGAAFIGFAPSLTAIVIAFSSYLFIATGLRVGYLFADASWMRRLSIVPGCLLIVIGVMKMLSSL